MFMIVSPQLKLRVDDVYRLMMWIGHSPDPRQRNQLLQSPGIAVVNHSLVSSNLPNVRVKRVGCVALEAPFALCTRNCP
jgi:hypothetical protein